MLHSCVAYRHTKLIHFIIKVFTVSSADEDTPTPTFRPSISIPTPTNSSSSPTIQNATSSPTLANTTQSPTLENTTLSPSEWNDSPTNIVTKKPTLQPTMRRTKKPTKKPTKLPTPMPNLYTRPAATTTTTKTGKRGGALSRENSKPSRNNRVRSKKNTVFLITHHLYRFNLSFFYYSKAERLERQNNATAYYEEEK